MNEAQHLQSMDALIIGAGAAGLSLAVELRGQGKRFILVERLARAGKARTRRREIEGRVWLRLRTHLA